MPREFGEFAQGHTGMDGGARTGNQESTYRLFPALLSPQQYVPGSGKALGAP